MTPVRQRILYIGAFAIGVFTSLFIYFRPHFFSPPSPAITPSLNNKTIFSTPLTQLNGQQSSLNSWQGKTLVINFWATWCAPCKQEIPELIKMRQQWLHRNVEFIGVAIDFEKDVQAFMNKTSIPYPILLAPNEGTQLMQEMGNTQGVLPFTVIIDPKQHTVERITGIINPTTLQERLNQLSNSHNY